MKTGPTLRPGSPLAVAALLALGSACEGPVDPGNVRPYGVQIGSEGLLRDCDTERAGATDSVDGFDFTPGELAARLAIDWGGALVTGDASFDGALSLQADGFATLAGEADCIGVWMDVSGTASFEPGLLAPVTGNLLAAPDGSAELVVWSGSWQGELQPTFDPAAMNIARMRMVGVASDSALAVTALFVGCDDVDCEAEEIGTLAATPIL